MENEIRAQEDRAIDVEKIIADLKEQGLLVDDIKKALEQMLKEGTINEEEFAKAQELLKALQAVLNSIFSCLASLGYFTVVAFNCEFWVVFFGSTV